MRIYFENSSILAEKVKAALEANDVDTAVSLMEDHKNYAAVKTGSSELVPILSNYICSRYETEENILFTGCVRLLEKLADVALVEDIIVQLLQMLERSDSTNFNLVLSNIFKVLQRAPREKTQYLSWCVNSIQVRLNKCQIPEYGENSVSSDDNIFYIEILYQDVLRFYDLIITFYSEQFQRNDEYRLILIKHLIQLLAKPIAYLDLGPHNKKSKLRNIAEHIVMKILTICDDPFVYLGMDDKDSLCPTIFAYGIFLYFLLDENVHHKLIPRVYDGTYLFCSSLVYIIKLLHSYSILVILKGCCTLEMLFKRIPKLSYSILDIKDNEKFCEVMEKIIIYNQHLEIRQRCLNIFNQYIHKFEPKGQYLLLTNLLSKIQHPGLSGFCIMQFKEIHCGLQKRQSQDLTAFEGENLYNFIDAGYRTIDTSSTLPYDKIISLLNLMRYTVILLRSEEIPKFRMVANIWREEFLSRLESSLVKLRRIIQQQIFNVENGNAEINFEFRISFENADDMDSLSKPHKLSALYANSNEIEMTHSLFKRLIELLEEKQC